MNFQLIIKMYCKFKRETSAISMAAVVQFILFCSLKLLTLVAQSTTPKPELGFECGRVPIYEKLYKKSINTTLAKYQNYSTKTNDQDDDNNGHFRILYGLDAVVGEWPWIARIKLCYKSGRCDYCTGSLINSKWIISAGHCGNAPGVVKASASLGLYDLVTPDKISIEISINKTIVHPDYFDLNNDLALFRLEREVEFGEYVQPVCLVGGEIKDLISYSQSRPCYAIGYGLTEGMNYAVKLQKLSVNTRSPSECNSDELNKLELRRGTVCIGPNNEKHLGSSCKGDSGGPNVCYQPETNSWHLFGLVSYGPSDCDREAGDKWLSVAADLTNYRTWVLTTAEMETNKLV